MPYKDPIKAKEQSKIRGKKWWDRNKESRRLMRKKYDEEHRIENANRSKDWYIKNKDKHKNNELRRLYGIGIEVKRQMYIDQKGICPVCNKILDLDFMKSCVDHDHNTGKVRKLLHRYCNVLVGVEENQPGIYKRLLEYLNASNLEKAV
jgi:hypothetical protein